ncbi:AfsR/SARP family transcriptional regulator [Phytoactinopolyspora halotolerans]|uniref:AfsR/SARP family transcriptional regulator n=1 Tax=Phytoactinopolyspora halotolerans TaxID=1981512 RepID=UPI0028A85E0E|nr:BTAD domain-containing putative transcriptional regulator [Phytoactinopolyspora halotolerans]
MSEHRRRLLAALLIRANRPVSTDILAEALWGDDLPAKSAKGLQMHVHRLRHVLDRPDRLVGVAGGYVLEVGPDELDADVFARLHTEARQAREAGDLDTAVAGFRAALALWRGRAYADVDGLAVVGSEARRLAEAGVIAREELYDAELARGSTREIVPELIESVAEFPLRERFTAQLMLALYRSGRQARALTAFRAARQRLADELGTEPGRELRELYDAIRAEDPSLLHDHGDGTVSAVDDGSSVTGGRMIPGQLPPPPGAFVGREAELAELEQVGMADDARVVVISGMAGVGKTALAIRFANEVADRFGNGQLYIDLRGYSSAPALEPMEALARMMRGLGAEAVRPTATLEDATAEYRSLIAGRKMLVLLDNAVSAEQVRPLLPATPGCLVLVTSRNRLSGLVAREGARRISLGVLPSADAWTLLTRILGQERLSRAPEHGTALVEACAELPLALRIAAAQLADEPYRGLDDYLAEFHERGLAALALDDDAELSAVTAAFDSSYRRLDHDTKRLFRLLGLVPGLDFTVDAAAALSGASVAGVRVHIRRLVNAHLLDEHAPGRYRFHDLVRDYARYCAEHQDSTDSRTDALERLYTWYYLGKEAATDLGFANGREGQPAVPLSEAVPEIVFSDGQEAADWLLAEFHNIVAAVWSSLGSERVHWSWHLMLGLAPFMGHRGFLAEVLAPMQSAADAVRAAGDGDAIAPTLGALAIVRSHAGLPVPDDVLTELIAHAERLGRPSLLGDSLGIAGLVNLRRGDIDAADEVFTRARAAFCEADDRDGQGQVLNHLANIAVLRGDLSRAERLLEQNLLLQDGAPVSWLLIAMIELLKVRTMLGRMDGLEELDGQAEQALRELGDRSKAAMHTINRARWARVTGRAEQARELAATAKQVGDDLEFVRHRWEARLELGMAYLSLRDPTAAKTEFEQVMEIVHAAGVREATAPAACGLAECELAAGALRKAEEHAREAVEAARGWSPVQLAEALVALARIELADGRVTDAITHADEALAIQRKTGHYLGQAHAHRAVGEAHIAADDPASKSRGIDHMREALRMFKSVGSWEATDVRQLLHATARPESRASDA